MSKEPSIADGTNAGDATSVLVLKKSAVRRKAERRSAAVRANERDEKNRLKFAEVANRIKASIRTTAIAAVEAGADLIRVKAQMRHGDFVRWVENECQIPIRSAQNFMKVARFIDAYLKGKNETVSHLPLSTLYKLSSKGTSERIRKKVASAITVGKPLTTLEVETLIKDERNERSLLRSNARIAEQLDERERHLRQEEELQNAAYKLAPEFVDVLLKLLPEDQRRICDALKDPRMARMIAGLLDERLYFAPVAVDHGS